MNSQIKNYMQRKKPNMKEMEFFKTPGLKLFTYFDSFSVLIKYFMMILLKIKMWKLIYSGISM